MGMSDRQMVIAASAVLAVLPPSTAADAITILVLVIARIARRCEIPGEELATQVRGALVEAIESPPGSGGYLC